jgi:hypothetical protein
MTEEFESLSTQESKENNFNEKFSKRLDEISLEIPEVEETRIVIEKGMKFIDEEFGLSPELLDKPHLLYLISLAQRYGALEENVEINKESDAYISEKEFIYDAVALVAYKKSSLYEKYAALITPESGIDEETRAIVYDKFTNQEATAELNKAIKDGLIDNVKKQLGITGENEDPYVLRVLNIGDETVMRGLEPYETREIRLAAYDDPARQKYSEKYRKYNEYQNNLKDNSKQFQQELGVKGDLAAAWKTTIDGVTTIALPLPIVEKLLHRQEKCTIDYTENDYSKDKAILEHEYVHSQGHVNLDEDTYLGIAAEELRAENFSGRKQGYGDVKSLDLLLQMISATNVSKEMSSKEKGGTADELFEFLANKIGLQRALEFSLTPPSNYPDKENTPLLFCINEHLGGLNGLVERLYGDAIKNGRGEAIDYNFDLMAKSIIGSSSKNEASFFYNKMKNIDKMPFGAELFRKKFEMMGAVV